MSLSVEAVNGALCEGPALGAPDGDDEAYLATCRRW